MSPFVIGKPRFLYATMVPAPKCDLVNPDLFKD